jgi:hypothetical protein
MMWVGVERAEALDVGVGDLDIGCVEMIERALGVDSVESTIVFRIRPRRAELFFLALAVALP